MTPQPRAAAADPHGWWLAISTSGADWSVWLGRGRDAVAPFDRGSQRILPGTRGQPRDLVGVIDDLLGAQGLRPADLTALVIDSGPGSFTSLRMGMATARALAWSLDLPVASVPSLRAMAAQACHLGACTPIASVLSARRGWWYAAWYDHDAALAGAASWDAWQAADGELTAGLAARAAQRPWTGVGALPADHPARQSARQWLPTVAPQACWCAAVALRHGDWAAAQLALPEYLAVSEAEAAADTAIAHEASEALSQLTLSAPTAQASTR